MEKSQQVTILGETFTGPMHICGFFDSSEEQDEVLLSYLKEGIDNKEEAISILDSKLHNDYRSKLLNAGIPVDEKLLNGQLKVMASNETYIKDNIFVSERMLNMVEQILDSAHNGSYGAIRICGDMEWAINNLPGTEDLIEYETRLNFITQKYHCCTLLCAYDLNKFSGRAIADILATHSHVILNGKIYANQHYTDPFEYLKMLVKRQRHQLAEN